MSGKRAVEGSTFITLRAVYRDCVSTTDDNGPTDALIPILDTSKGPHTDVGLGQGESNQYGQNAQLDIAVILNGFTAATVQVWLKAEVESHHLTTKGQAPASSSACPAPGTADWVLVKEEAVSGSQLVIIKDIPPGKYKILVSTTAGVGTIKILEQHAA